jgi:hypothetical protein
MRAIALRLEPFTPVNVRPAPCSCSRVTRRRSRQRDRSQRLAVNPPSRLYPTRRRGDLIAQFLGSPVRDVSRQQAAYYAAQGR